MGICVSGFKLESNLFASLLNLRFVLSTDWPTFTALLTAADCRGSYGASFDVFLRMSLSNGLFELEGGRTRLEFIFLFIGVSGRIKFKFAGDHR